MSPTTAVPAGRRGASQRGRAQSPARRRGLPQWALYLLGLGFALLVLLPVGYMVSVAMSPRASAGTTLLPDELTMAAFTDVWQVVDLAGFLRNSLIASASTAVASSVVGLGAAYVLARFRFRGREFFRTSLLAAYTTPGIVIMIPLYVVYVQIQNLLTVQIIGSLPLLILTYMSFSLPYSVWMLTGYLLSLPESVEEAATIDGAGRLRMLASIVLPLALPAVVVTAVFSFVLAWNDVLFASVLTSNTTRTVGVGMQVFATTATEGGLPQWNNLMAAGIITAVPAVVLFIVIQRYLISGLTAGSVKG